LIELKLQRRICESGGIRVKPMAESRLRITGTKMAVLPFTCRAGHAESEDLASGLTEDIAAGLARFRYLSVIAKSQSGARYLLEGSVRHSATAVRVTARLVDADTGAHLWADSYTRDSQGADLFALQDDIASRIVATVADSAGVLVRAIGGPLRERPCDQLSIDELILRWLLFVQNFDGAERERLLAAFENALKREPGHADAWAALAGLHNLAYVNSPDRPPELLERLHAAAKRALDLDPFCLRGWFGLAIWSVHTHDHAGMLTAVQRAIALNPWDSTALAGIARLHAFVGDYEDAVANAHRAMELNAHHPEWYKIPLLFDACRRRAYDEALQIVKRLAAPHERLMTAFHIAILGNLQHREEAIGALDALAMHSPAWLDTQRVRGLFAFAISDQQLLADLVDGFVKAKILADIS
jgi:TolB-like protein